MTSTSGPGAAAGGRHAGLVASLRRAVLESPGSCDRAVRAAAASPPQGRAGALPPVLASYVEKVSDASYRISDADFGALAAHGYGEDEIFEITVAAALGTALRGLDAGLRAVGEGT